MLISVPRALSLVKQLKQISF